MSNRLSLNLIYLAIAACIAFAIPTIVRFDSYILHLFILTGITIILVTSLRLVFITGIWNVGQAAFYAIGAYTMHFLVKWAGLSFWIALPITGIAAAVVALGLGYVTLRVKGVYFAILSLAFVEIVRLAITNAIGAQNTIVSTPPPSAIIIPHVLTMDFSGRADFYYLMLCLLGVCLFSLYKIENSPFGRTLKFISERGALSESIGINVMRHEVLAFTIGSFFAGVAGGFFASYVSVISPDVFSVWYSIILLVMMIVGGMFSFWGPVIGATLLVTLPTLLPSGAPKNIFYAVLVITILFLLPKGLVSLPQTIRSSRNNFFKVWRKKEL